MRFIKGKNCLYCESCKESQGYLDKGVYVSGYIYCKSCRIKNKFHSDDATVERWDKGIFQSNFTDFELQGSDGGVVRCHKVILVSLEEICQLHVNYMSTAGKNKIFKAMFNSNMSESREGRVRIPNMTGSALRYFVEFLYTGTILPKGLANHAPELFKGSHLYDVPRLTKLCEEFLGEHASKHIYAIIDIISTYYSASLEKSILPHIFCEDFVVSNDPEYVIKTLSNAWMFESFEEYKKENMETVLEIMGKATKLMAGYLVTNGKNDRGMFFQFLPHTYLFSFILFSRL